MAAWLVVFRRLKGRLDMQTFISFTSCSSTLRARDRPTQHERREEHKNTESALWWQGSPHPLIGAFLYDNLVEALSRLPAITLSIG